MPSAILSINIIIINQPYTYHVTSGFYIFTKIRSTSIYYTYLPIFRAKSMSGCNLRYLAYINRSRSRY